jgi:hypothetical protein
MQKNDSRGAVSVFFIMALAVLMLIATAAFIVVAHPPVFIADLLMSAHARPASHNTAPTKMLNIAPCAKYCGRSSCGKLV